MIPKKIHYIWFGNNPIPDEYAKYIAEWKEKMPDYEFQLWNEDNYTLGYNNFAEAAKADKAWAFVSDYIRLKVLYEWGGIYLDTDEKVLQPFDCFLNHSVFFGQETGYRLQAGVIGCEPRSPMIKSILEHYDTMIYTPTCNKNNLIIGDQIYAVLKAKHPELQLSDDPIYLSDGISIYPSRYFCPDLATLHITPTSYTIHIPNGSWLTWQNRIRTRIYKLIVSNTITRRLYNYIKR